MTPACISATIIKDFSQAVGEIIPPEQKMHRNKIKEMKKLCLKKIEKALSETKMKTGFHKKVYHALQTSFLLMEMSGLFHKALHPIRIVDHRNIVAVNLVVT